MTLAGIEASNAATQEAAARQSQQSIDQFNADTAAQANAAAAQASADAAQAATNAAQAAANAANQ